MAHVRAWLRNSLAGDLPPRPGDGAQHDAEGTGCQGGEEAEVQRALHAIVAHAHHRVQVVLKGSDTKYGSASTGTGANLLPRADQRSISHEEKSLYGTLVGTQSSPLPV